MLKAFLEGGTPRKHGEHGVKLRKFLEKINLSPRSSRRTQMKGKIFKKGQNLCFTLEQHRFFCRRRLRMTYANRTSLTTKYTKLNLWIFKRTMSKAFLEELSPPRTRSKTLKIPNKI